MWKRRFFGCALLCASLSVRAVELVHNVYKKDVKVYTVYSTPTELGGFYEPGCPVRMSIDVKNMKKTSTQTKIEFSVNDYDGKEVFVGSAQSLLPPQTKAKTFILQIPPPKRNGFFTVNAKVYADNVLNAKTQGSFVVLPPQKGGRDKFFSMDCNQLERRLIEAYKRVGFGTIALKFAWYWYVNSDRYDFERAIQQIDFWEKKQKTFLDSDFCLIGYMQPDYRPCEWDKDVQKRIADNRFWIRDELFQYTEIYGRELAKRFKNRIKTWFIQGEIDAHCNTVDRFSGSEITMLASYYLFSQNLYRGLKSGNPDCKVTVGGIMGADYFNANPPFKYLRMILKDLHPNFDGINIDAYTGIWNGMQGELTPPESGGLRDYIIDAAKMSKDFNCGYRVYNAERCYAVGLWHRLDNKLNKHAGDLTARSVIISKGSPCKLYTFHYSAELISAIKKGVNATRPGFGAWNGGLDSNGKLVFSPRPMIFSFALVARELAFTKAYKVVVLGDIQAYIFTMKDGTQKVCLWTTDKPVKIKLNLPSAELTDSQGNKTKLAAGKTVLALNNSPIYVHWNGNINDSEKIVRAMNIISNNPIMSEGRRIGTNTMLLNCINRTGKTIKGALKIPGVREQKISLPAFKHTKIMATVPLSFDGAANLVTAEGKKYPLNLDYSFAEAGFMKTVPIFDGTGRWMDSLKSVKLRVPDAVVPQRMLVPELGLFKYDETDFKADLYFAWDNKNFYFGAKVSDKVHVQRYERDEIWKDDAIQFAISTRFNTVLKPFPNAKKFNKYGKHDYNLGLALTKKGTQLFRWGQSTGNYTLLGFPSKVTRGKGITVYETAIPWSYLKTSPKPDGAIRFSAAVPNNDDPSILQMPYRLEYGGGVMGFPDVSNFKTVLLKSDSKAK